MAMDSKMSSSEQLEMSGSTHSLSNVLTTWHVAYHGLPIAHVRRVLDAGQLYASKKNEWAYVPPPNKSPGNGKDGKTDLPQLIFSPVIQYAGIPTFSRPTRG